MAKSISRAKTAPAQEAVKRVPKAPPEAPVESIVAADNGIKRTFSLLDLTTMLQNTATMCRRPPGFEPNGIPERRLAALHKFCEAYKDVTMDFIREDVLRPQEAVLAHVSIALLIQLTQVNNTPVLPNGVVSKETLDLLRKLVADR